MLRLFLVNNPPSVSSPLVLLRVQGECRLQMEAQRLSLSQIHAAQLELLQEETVAAAAARTHSLQLRLDSPTEQGESTASAW